LTALENAATALKSLVKILDAGQMFYLEECNGFHVEFSGGKSLK